MSEATGDKESSSRRRFLGFLGAIGLGWLGAALYPVYKYLSPQKIPDPFGEDGLALVENIVPIDVAQSGMGKSGAFGGRGIIIYRNSNSELRAFDSKCTHAGCNVEFQGERFFCHCHGGTYDLNGKNVAGPPPKPLTEYGVEEKEGLLYVFRLDIPRPEVSQS
jgi:Rieske Fe-S protein